jgi:hypothetical protein
LRPWNLKKERYCLVLGAEKGGAFDKGVNPANFIDTAAMAAVYKLPDQGFRLKIGAECKRHSTK